jgi:hypothetical protein
MTNNIKVFLIPAIGFGYFEEKIGDLLTVRSILVLCFKISFYKYL